MVAGLALVASLARAQPYPEWLERPRTLIGRDACAVLIVWDDGLVERRHVADAVSAARALRDEPGVRGVWPAFAAVAPPHAPDFDLAPPTPSFALLQRWTAPAPLGLGSLVRWPGGRGDGVRVADVEYDYDPLHEDLRTSPPRWIYGEPWGSFGAHGNGVLGLLTGGYDGFGVLGAVTLARVGVAHPQIAGEFDLVGAVQAAAAWLDAGDVLLIEQQLMVDGALVPVSADPLIAQAIRAAVARGVVVVEPAGNGGVNLDDAAWEGWFSPGGGGDTGALLVGAGDPETGERSDHSNYGARVAVQGWSDGVVTLSSSGAPSELWFPDGDVRQAYTASFGGTSAAAAQVAGLCAQVQGVSRSLHGEPVPPERLAAWLVRTGRRGSSPELGPRPDVEALARAYLRP